MRFLPIDGFVDRLPRRTYIRAASAPMAGASIDWMAE